jgi:hypothetical protein
MFDLLSLPLPLSQVVTGLPTNGLRSGEYGRDVVPEMLSGCIAPSMLTSGSWVIHINSYDRIVYDYHRKLN